MRDTLTAICASVLLLVVAHKVPESLSWDMGQYSSGMIGCVWIAWALKSLKRNDLIQKSLILSLLFYIVTETNFNLLYAVLGYNIYINLYWLISTVFFITLLYTRYKKYNYKSDEIKDNNNIYFCFWKPKAILPLTTSLFGAPFGGLSIYTCGNLYGFRWKKETYQKELILKESVQRKFTVFDTGIKANDVLMVKLHYLVGCKAGKLRIKCLKILKPFLSAMGPKFSPKTIETPSEYFLRVAR